MTISHSKPTRGLAWMLALCGLCLNLFGQERFGEISGTIKDPTSAAIPNAMITLTNLQTQKVNRFKTDGSGGYVAKTLEPGHYKARIEASGFSATEFPDLLVLLGKVLTVDASLTVGNTTETVQISDVAPLIDTSTTQVSTNVTSEEFNRMPKARTFQSLVALSPTATTGDLEGGIQVNGASAGENNFIVDGITTTSVLQGQSRTNAAFEILEEVQIKTSGIEAQYGGATGGVISAITRSGGNAFHGDIHYYFQGNSIAAGPVQRLLMNPTDLITTGYVQDNKQKNDTHEIGYALGGYFVKNRVYFFSAASPRFQARDQKYLTSDNQTTNLHQDQTFWQAYNKVSVDITSKLRLNAAFYWSPFSRSGELAAYSLNGNQSTNSKASLDANKVRGFFNPQSNYNADVTYTVTPTTLINLRFGRNYDNYKALGVPDVSAIEWGTPSVGIPGLDQSLQLAKGATNIPRVQNTFYDIATRTNLQLDVNKIVRFGGQHDFKVGLGRMKMVNNVNVAYGGGGYVTLFWNTPYLDTVTKKTDQGAYGYYTVDDIGTKGTTGGTIDNIYFQDRWRVTSRLSIDLGLRLENEKVPSFRPDIQKTAFAFDWGQKIAPRLGASFDVFGNGKMKVYGSYGLFYDWIKYELSRGTFGGDHWNQYYRSLDTLDVLKLGNGNLPGRNLFAGGAAPYLDLRIPAFGSESVDPKIKPLSTALTNVGVEYQLRPKVVVAARYTRSILRNAIEDVGTLDANGSEVYLYGNPGQGLVAKSSPSGKIVPSFALPRPQRDYNAMDISVNRRFANHFFLAGSYTYSRLYGNYAGLVSTDEVTPPSTGRTGAVSQQSGGQATRAGTSSSRYYDLDYLQWDAHGNVGNYGLLATDHPHQFKIYGSYEMPWKRRSFGSTEIGWNYFIQSGTPQSTQVSSTQNAPVLVNGRGDLGRSPVISQTDMVVSHTFFITERQRIRLEFNAQNLFNQKTAQILYTFLNRYRTNASEINYTTFDFTKTYDYKALIATSSDARTKPYGALDPRFGKGDLFRTGFIGRFGLKYIF